MSFEDKQSNIENVDSSRNAANNVSALHADTFSMHMNSTFEAMQKSQGGIPREFGTPSLTIDHAPNDKTAGLNKAADSRNNNPDRLKPEPDSGIYDPDDPKKDPDFTLPDDLKELLRKQDNYVLDPGLLGDNPNLIKSDEEMNLILKSLKNIDPILLTPEERQKLYPKGIPVDPRAEWEKNVRPAAN